MTDGLLLIDFSACSLPLFRLVTSKYSKRNLPQFNGPVVVVNTKIIIYIHISKAVVIIHIFLFLLWKQYYVNVM